jgi:putative oxygen-independent coproporphyrinogen III oxidase
MSDGSDGVGLYVHFPYCTRRCDYCDFTLTTPKVLPAARYTDALLAELSGRIDPGDDRPGIASSTPLRSLYIGGGTPSLWPLEELARFVAAVRHRLMTGAEVTLEANPDEVDDRYLERLVALGVNRVSLGVQSLDDRRLVSLSRTHGRDGALRAVTALARARHAGGLGSFSIDLMYGLAGQSLEAWLAELRELLTYEPPHLSLYALTVETRTMLAFRIRKGQLTAPDDGLQGDMMFAARDLLAAHGFTHYEVSSFARPGHLATHNSAYWDMTPYLALGAGAHGFLSGDRYVNEPRPSRYVERALAGERVESSIERPDPETLAFERVMTGLRRLDRGLAFDAEARARFGPMIAVEVAGGRLVDDGERVTLTDLGLRFMDDVLLRLSG